MNLPYGVDKGWNRYWTYREASPTPENGVGMEYTPSVCFNGLQDTVILKQSYEEYKSNVDSERSKDTSVVISAEKLVSGTVVTITAQMTNGYDSELTDVSSWFVIYEDLGSPGAHYVVRDIVQGPKLSSFAAGETQNFNIELSLTDSDMSKVQAVVLLQRQDLSEVLQATLATSK